MKLKSSEKPATAEPAQSKRQKAKVVEPEQATPAGPKIYCGVDNGSSGSVAIISPGLAPFWMPTPVVRCRNYQKVEKHLNRVDAEKLFDILHDRVYDPVMKGATALVLLERPYCNPHGFNASLLAARALEATLVVVDLLGLSYQFVDSKEWQSVMLPKGIIGRDELKAASAVAGRQLFPDTKFKKDADSLLMAEWANRKRL